jgi:ABC-2 type transport system ATP-binding protein
MPLQGGFRYPLRVRELAIEVRGLRKSYGHLEAVAGIDLQVARGEIFAMLGPNGAGKTTTVEVLEGYRNPSSGQVSVLGFDPSRGGRPFKQRIGIVLQETSVESYLTVEETIDMYRGYFASPYPLEALLGLVGISEQRRTRVKRLSGGQQRRLDVAIGLAGDPELLFLDEPTTGFDPAARRGAWEMLRGLKALGKTIFLTTHYMDEAQRLADRVAIISRGKIVALGTPDELINIEPNSTIRFRYPVAAREFLAGIEGVRSQDGYVTVRTPDPTTALYQITSHAHAGGLALEELTVSRPSLEDMYLRLVGESEAQQE